VLEEARDVHDAHESRLAAQLGARDRARLLTLLSRLADMN
jgi:hypothetical protein